MSRGQESLDFHFNASLTALNLAKIDAYASFGYNADTPFSMATQKSGYFNEHMMQQFGQMLGLFFRFIKNHAAYDRLRTHGINHEKQQTYNLNYMFFCIKHKLINLCSVLSSQMATPDPHD